MTDREPDDGIQIEPNSDDVRPIRPRDISPAASDALQVEYHLKVEDFMAFYDHVMLQSNEAFPGKKRGKSSHARVLFTALSMLGIFGIVAKRLDTFGTLDTRSAVITGILILLILVLWCWNPFMRVLTKRGIRHNRILFEPFCVVLTPEALVYSAGPTTTQALWVGVFKVVETEDHLFVHTSANEGLVIPRRAFSKREQYDAFAEAAFRYYRNTRPRDDIAIRGIRIKK